MNGGGGDVKPAVVNEFLQRKQEARNNKLRVKQDLGIGAGRPVGGVAAALQPYAAYNQRRPASANNNDAGVDDYMSRLQRIRKQNMDTAVY